MSAERRRAGATFDYAMCVSERVLTIIGEGVPSFHLYRSKGLEGVPMTAIRGLFASAFTM
jgi:hypothetical protein